ncbi:hypothetical protein KA405_00465 [Patescibacteria group bacterium]|nr:hypothetical protein [Patescibacteria group bacterium]
MKTSLWSHFACGTTAKIPGTVRRFVQSAATSSLFVGIVFSGTTFFLLAIYACKSSIHATVCS